MKFAAAYHAPPARKNFRLRSRRARSFPTILSDVGGPIKRLLLHVNDTGPLRPLLDIIRALPGATPVIAGRPSAHARARRALMTVGLDPALAQWLVVDAPSLSLWARDSFVVLESPDDTRRILTSGASPDEPNPDATVPLALADFLGWPVIHGAAYLEGGNLVTNRRYTFAGWDFIADNTAGWSDAALSRTQRRLERRLGRRLVILGTEDHIPPLDHLDMFLTPLGGRHVLLGDPTLALRLLASLPPGELIDLAVRTELPDGERDGFSLHDAMAHNAGDAVTEIFDLIQSQLQEAGCVVHRIPLLVTDDERELPILSYNNVLMERGANGPHVLLPQYGVDVLDHAARDIWTSLGYAVSAIDLSTALDLHGAVRCLTQVLQRSSSRSAAAARPPAPVSLRLASAP